ncbi:somatostatin-1A-like [Protopterus annectens]|uniref:somatostatin-1A-like n=1 Tax=Protopterus annectens TaxID=7888 RepID=UPI001CFA9C16|nr:somatostatin-1A-like [Protopterus annectens]
MLQFHLQVLFCMLSVSVLLLSGTSGAPMGDSLTDLLQQDGKEELSRVLVLKMLSDLIKAENEAFPSSMEDSGIRDEVVRHLSPARERKAGCKNFFWKTFTSC